MFASTASSWKCAVCLSAVPSDKIICGSCETPKAGCEAAAEEAKKAAAPTSIGGNFTFGSAPGAASPAPAASNFTFGVPAAAAASSPAAPAPPSGTGGFVFGGVPAAAASSPAPAAGTGFVFGGVSAASAPAPAPAASDETDEMKQAREVFVKIADGATSLPPSQFEALLDELGTGLSGDEYTAQLEAVLAGGTAITAASLATWFSGFLDAGDESDADSEVAEERVKAEEAFTSLLDEGASVLDAELFPNTFEALGSTYDPNDVRSIPPHYPNHASLER
jgi:hypothetical protein